MKYAVSIIVGIFMMFSSFGVTQTITRADGTTCIIQSVPSTCTNPLGSSTRMACANCQTPGFNERPIIDLLVDLLEDANDSHCSFIDNANLNYLSRSIDWSLGKAKGCSTCGGGSSLGSLSKIQIERIQSVRNMTEHSSYGSGYFSNYDVHLAAVYKNTSNKNRIEYFDPIMLVKFSFKDDDNDGLFETTSKMYKSLTLYDASDIQTGDLTLATKAVIRNFQNESIEFELIDIDGLTKGRYTNYKNINNYGIDITYASYTPAEITADPHLQWQIDTITDAQGRVATFHYGTAQTNGEYTISSIDLPNVQTITYTYSSGELSNISHPDGTSSTFSREIDVATGLILRTYSDAMATAKHRNKEVYLTSNVTGLVGLKYDDIEFFNSSSEQVRMVIGGTNEVKYLNTFHATAANRRMIYTGAQKAKFQDSFNYVKFYKDDFDFTDPTLGYSAFTGSRESKYASQPPNSSNKFAGTPANIYDIQRKKYYFKYDSQNYPTMKTYNDGSFEITEYNSLQLVTRYQDRLGRVTKYEYDANGNLTKTQVGFKMVESLVELPDVDLTTGKISHETWNNLSGSDLSFFDSMKYTAPDVSGELTTFQGNTNTSDNYATRVSGFIHPPTTGLYTFWCSGDDNVDLYLSTDDSRVNKVKIASVTGWTNPLQWNKFATQQSVQINLVAGEKYYIELLHKEGGGGDNFAAAWEGPGITQIVIDGAYLSKYNVANHDYFEDVVQAEFAEYINEYYTTGELAGLLKYEFDANNNRKEFIYYISTDTTGNPAGLTRLLKEVKEPDDTGVGYHTAKSYTYDSTGRVASSTDAMGRTSSYQYDKQDRQVKVTYHDTSTECWVYGSGNDKNLLVKYKDRNGNVSEFEYDLEGRKTKTIVAAGTADKDLDASFQLQNFVAITDTSIKVETIYEYLDGTEKVSVMISAGDRTEFVYDYRHRLIETKRFPRAGKILSSKSTYIDNLLFSSEDPYGRKSYNLYRNSDNALIRTIQGTSPTYSKSNFTQVTNESRDLNNNANRIITDYELDIEKQQTAMIDGRSIRHETEYDSLGRVTAQTIAVGTTVEAKTETIYDANSNVIEMRSPRYFDSGDTEGFNNANTEMTYTRRNLMKTVIAAADSTIAATQSFTYYNDGSSKTKIDFRGNTWETLWHQCCSRFQGSVDPAGHGTLSNVDYFGNVTHTAVVKDLSAEVSTNANGLNVVVTAHSVPDAKTINETTTRYDERHRPTAATKWLVKQGNVDPNNVPIAEGATSADGLTTTYEYDDHVGDGLDLDTKLTDLIAKLTADGITFDSNQNGSAVIVTNAEGEVAASIRDGIGRTVITGILDPNNNDVIIWNTTLHDTVEDNLLNTKSIDAVDNTVQSFTDGVGRGIKSKDAELKVSTAEYDANSNAVKTRDANSVGLDCVFDERNRDTSCTDTDGDTITKAYNDNNQVVTSTDAKLEDSTMIYDARGRSKSTTDRVNATTAYVYDDNSNLLSVTDAQSKETTYVYDTRNLQTKSTYADHVVASNPGDIGYGITECSYDAAMRLDICTDQKGETVNYAYDLANRMTTRTYKDISAIVESTDTVTYDKASRMLTAVKGRYSNTVTQTYDDAGRLEDEKLTINGTTYTTTHSYDDASRMATCTYPDGSKVTYDWTDRYQIKGLDYTPNGGTIGDVIDFTYDNGQREGTRTFKNNLITTTTYNLDNTTASKTVAGKTSLSFTYTYDANKNVTREAVGGVMANYSWDAGFDDDDRVNSWDRDNGTDIQSWNLSLIGNWDSVTKNAVLDIRLFSNAHEGTQVNGQTVNYDAKGNQTLNQNARSFVWDIDNHLKSTTHSTEDDADYEYDALGRRVSKTVGVNETVYICKGSQVIVEYVNGSLSQKYVYGAYIDDPIALIKADETMYHYHCNRQFNVVGITDSTGAIVEHCAYETYGKQTVYDVNGNSIAGTTVNNPYGYTGRRLDAETGNWYFRARYYDDEQGRFISRDPLGYVDGMGLYNGYFAQGFNLDPSGNRIIVHIGGADGNGGSKIATALQRIVGTCAHIYAVPIYNKNRVIASWEIKYKEIKKHVRRNLYKCLCKGKASEAAWKMIKHVIDKKEITHVYHLGGKRGGSRELDNVYIDAGNNNDTTAPWTPSIGIATGLSQNEYYEQAERKREEKIEREKTEYPGIFGVGSKDGKIEWPYEIQVFHEVIAHDSSLHSPTRKDSQHNSKEQDNSNVYDPTHQMENIARRAWNENNGSSHQLRERSHFRNYGGSTIPNRPWGGLSNRMKNPIPRPQPRHRSGRTR